MQDDGVGNLERCHQPIGLDDDVARLFDVFGGQQRVCAQISRQEISTVRGNEADAVTGTRSQSRNPCCADPFVGELACHRRPCRVLPDRHQQVDADAQAVQPHGQIQALAAVFMEMMPGCQGFSRHRQAIHG